MSGPEKQRWEAVFRRERRPVSLDRTPWGGPLPGPGTLYAARAPPEDAPGRELCVAAIAEQTGSTQSAVSHQLRTPKQAGLVKFQRDGRNVVYSLADDHVYTMLNQGMSHICE